MASPFYTPLFALAALIGVIWLLAVIQRVQEIAARRIRPQALINTQTTANTLTNGAAMLVPSSSSSASPLMGPRICSPGATRSGFARPSPVGPRLEK